MTSDKDMCASVKDFLLWGLKGLAIGIIAAAVILFALSGVAYSMEDPGKFAEPFGYAALMVSAAISGIVAARVSGEKGAGAAISGGTAGIMMLVLLLILTIIPAEAAKEPLSTATTILMYAAVPIIAFVSGFLFRKKESRRHHRKRRR